MNISQVNNAEFVINYKNAKELAQAERMVAWIENDTGKRVVCAATDHYEHKDEREGYFHMTTTWDNYQAKELKELYKESKKATK